MHYIIIPFQRNEEAIQMVSASVKQFSIIIFALRQAYHVSGIFIILFVFMKRSYYNLEV